MGNKSRIAFPMLLALLFSVLPSYAQQTDAQQHAQEVLGRVQVVRAKAMEAVKLSGSQKSKSVAMNYAFCSLGAHKCMAAIASEQDPIGRDAGLAMYLINGVYPGLRVDLVLQAEPRVQAAEVASQRAHESAEQIASAHQQEQAAVDAEQPTSIQAVAECQKNPAECKTKCEHGDPWQCFGRAITLSTQTTPDFAEAKKLMDSACSASIASACSIRPQLDVQEKDHNAKTDALWERVTIAIDHLAGAKFEHKKVVTYHVGGRYYPRVLKSATDNESSVTTEMYCPAKKDFVDAAGAAEFSRRVTAFCASEEAPTGNGYSGALVPLNSECREVLTAPCQ